VLKTITPTSRVGKLISSRIFEHIATKLDQVTDFIKLGSVIIFRHFATIPDPVTELIKLRSAFPSKAPLLHQNYQIRFPFYRRIHPFYFKIEYSLKPDPGTLIQIHALFVLYKHVS
jgi:hypothetical protein